VIDDAPLLDVAAALADGTVVDWESAARSLTSDDDRRLLTELRFIEDLARGAQTASTAVAAGECWGPLKILEHVGRGAFGDVYRAWDNRLDREVALKILRRDEAGDQTHAQTVIREGQLLARVRHPNVATVYGAERIGDQIGVWMEFVQGKTLEQTLRDEGPFAVDRATRVGIELSGALSAIHRAGLIHRDVKTQTVLCDGDGRLVLTDFGAGCDVRETTSGASRDLAGTPIFIAPEILEGQSATPQADVYSLGVVLYHLVTGTYPVSGRSLRDIREAHARGRRIPLATARPDFPRAFVRVIDRAIDPRVANRYESPDAFGAALALHEHATPRRKWLVPLAAVVFAGALLWAAGAGLGGRASG
jgi:serine/threonine-protein kinase